MKKILVYLLLWLWIPPAYSQTSDCWPGFRGNQGLTGVSPVTLPERPALLWKFQTGDNIKSSPVVCSNRIVVSSTDGFVYCLDMQGKELWRFKSPNGFEAPPLVLDNRVYIGNMDGTLYALDLANGRKIWEYGTENQIVGAVNYWKADNRTYLLVGSYDYYLHCVDAATGSNIWKYESDNFINGAAAAINGQAVFGGCDGFLHVVDIRSGKAIRKVNVDTYVAGSTAVEGTSAWFGDYDGKFSSVDLVRGSRTWRWEDPQVRLPFIASPAIVGNRVISGNHDKHIYAWDKNSGALIWKFNTGNRVEASPVVAGNRVLTANMRGDLHLLNVSSGQPSWSYELGAAIIGNPAVAAGRIIVGANDGFVYCFGSR